MNKKKLFLFIGIGVILFIILFIILILTFGSKDDKNKITAKDFKIWILKDSKDDFKEFIEDFKKANIDTIANSFDPHIETFENYKEYSLALASAFAKGEGPDLFMLSNNEKSLFLEHAVGINPSIISPDELRNNFKGFFADDLIMSSGRGDDKIEFLAGVPFGYETLGTFFNFRKIQNIKNLQNFSYIDGLVKEKSRDGFVPIGLGDGTTTINSGDIFLQFLMGGGINSIQKIDISNLKEALMGYFSFNSGDNNYSSLNLANIGSNNIEAFCFGKIGAIFAYPRDIYKIDKYGFAKNFLRATLFPEFINDSKKIVRYNYFVINKNSQNQELALKILFYLFSERGEKDFLKHFKYYIPARMSLYEDVLNRDIFDGYHIKLKSFYNSDALYSSFDKGLKVIYDKEIKYFLDKPHSYLEKTNEFFNTLKCMTTKVLRLENLSKNCEE